MYISKEQFIMIKQKMNFIRYVRTQWRKIIFKYQAFDLLKFSPIWENLCAGKLYHKANNSIIDEVFQAFPLITISIAKVYFFNFIRTPYYLQYMLW